MWDYQVKLFVDTKVGNHGCRRRKSHHHWTALCGFFFAPSAGCEINLHKVSVRKHVFFPPPVPNMGWLCRVQALTIEGATCFTALHCFVVGGSLF